MFWHKKKAEGVKAGVKKLTVEEKERAETVELYKELERQHNTGITRVDYLVTVLDILIELHPEIGTHPNMNKFREKVARYLSSQEKVD